MTSLRLSRVVLLASAFLYGAVAHGDTVYRESVSGDLSNSGSAPTLITISLGENDVFGTTGKDAASGNIDRDYFKFTVPQVAELTGITVLTGTTTLGAGGLSFIGIESGSTVTVSPTGTRTNSLSSGRGVAV
jgi:glycerol-3-phosphate acyltransferase PlsY